jgi:hypothetical protein
MPEFLWNAGIPMGCRNFYGMPEFLWKKKFQNSYGMPEISMECRNFRKMRPNFRVCWNFYCVSSCPVRVLHIETSFPHCRSSFPLNGGSSCMKVITKRKIIYCFAFLKLVAVLFVLVNKMHLR